MDLPTGVSSQAMMITRTSENDQGAKKSLGWTPSSSLREVYCKLWANCDVATQLMLYSSSLNLMLAILPKHSRERQFRLTRYYLHPITVYCAIATLFYCKNKKSSLLKRVSSLGWTCSGSNLVLSCAQGIVRHSPLQPPNKTHSSCAGGREHGGQSD